MRRASRFKFRLYVASGAQNSLEAISNLSALCGEHLHDRYDMEIVDVFQEPDRALADGIFMTPTLLKCAPKPVTRIVGTLSQKQVVLQSLGLESRKT
jgi:circadian clock protein KaiB